MKLSANDRLLDREEVSARTGLPRSTIYRLMSEGNFPLNIRVGARAVRWSETELEAWLASRPRYG
ncbi:MAG: AlpA family phage regulatory protein [Rhodospirillaceae bacterium]|nr:AlpA family phage regulatory protein [Rhodospirillaceae bacterium]